MQEDGSGKKGFRVKLYQLEADGAWVDVGTGNLVCTYVEELKAPALILMNEENPHQILLMSKIQLDDIYERQGESIIMWRDKLPTGDEDNAVSFQNTNDCQTIWDAIGEIQNQYLQHNEYGIQPNFFKKSPSINPQLSSDSLSPQPLPSVTIEALPDIKSLIMNISPFDKDGLASRLMAHNFEYLRQLLDLFEMLERIEDISSLNIMAEIWRALLLLNDSNIVHYAITDEFMRVIGIFEYDPALRSRGRHRHFFTNEATLREVIPLEDENLKSSIHSLYRMRYLKDYLLRPSIDETGANALMGMMTACAIDVCSKIFEGSDYLAKVIDAIVMYSYANQDAVVNDRSNQPIGSPREKTRLLGDIIQNGRFMAERSNSPSNSTCGVDGDDSDDDSDSTSSLQHSVESDHKNHLVSSSLASSVVSPRNLRLDGIKFVRELFFLTKNFHWDRRYDFYSSFLKKFASKFFRFVCEVVNPSLPSQGDPTSDSIERQLVAEILSTIASACTQELRRYILSCPLPPLPDQPSLGGKQSKINSETAKTSLGDPLSSNLLLSIILGIIDGDDVIVVEHLSDVVRCLIEPDVSHRPHLPEHNPNMSYHSESHIPSTGPVNASSKQDMEKFLTAFYDCYVHWLIIPFVEPNEGHLPRKLSSIPPQMRSKVYHATYNIDDRNSFIGASRRCIIDVLTTCVSRHAYRMKYFVMRSGLLAKLNRFLSSLYQPSSHPALRHLQINIVKFWRALISTKDEFYFRHVVKLDLLTPLLQALEKELLNLHQQRIAATIIASPSTKKISRFQESLIASAVVELLSFLGETSPSLIVYVVEKLPNFPVFSIDSAEPPAYNVAGSFVEVFKQLRIKYDDVVNPTYSQINTNSADHPSQLESNRINRKRNREFLEQVKEESYYESDDDYSSDFQLLPSDHRSTNEVSTAQIDPIQKPKSLSKDSLQLLADFYSDYESDDDIPLISETSPHSSNSSSSLSPREDDLAEKRRRIAKIRDLVDFGVSGSISSAYNASGRSLSPTQSLNNAGDSSNGYKSAPQSSNLDYNEEFPSPLQLPPIRSKYEDLDHDLTKDEFLKRAAKYSQSRTVSNFATSVNAKSSNNASYPRIVKSDSLSSFENVSTLSLPPIQSSTPANQQISPSNEARMNETTADAVPSAAFATKQIFFSLTKKK